MKKIFTMNLACLVSVSGMLTAQEREELSPSQAQALIQEWVKAERLVRSEMADWELKRIQMEEVLVLYAKEISLLREEIEAGGESLKNEDSEREGLKASLESMRGERKALAELVVASSERLLKLSERFPEPLKMQVGESLAILAEVKGEGQVREGLVALLDVLKQAGRFNRVVTVSDQIEEMGDGSKRKMEVLYLGLGAAYYVSGETGGVGRPGVDGWVWSERGGIKGSVVKALAIFNKTAQPGLVELPVEVAR